MPVAGQQFEYAYDDIGNRISTRAGGDANGGGLRLANSTANSLNQYSSRDVPGTNDIIGIAHPSATVTVNDQSVYRKGEYYWKELAISNGSATVWQGVTNIASLGGTNQTNIGNLLLPKTQQNFWHDADGNLLSDNVWTNTWNGENRLTTNENTAAVPSAARAKQTWTFDDSGRWMQRIVYSWNGSAYVASYTNRFVWDGNVLLAMLDHTNGLVMSFERGLDLGGSLQAAGGAGGLLAVNTKTNGVHFCAYDGNGNVAALVGGKDGSVSGTYEYDPFANTMRVTGIAAKANPIRFSTQFADEVASNLKYLYRDYQPAVERWLSRDPVNETGGKNLYRFVRNDPVRTIDIFGLCFCRCTGRT